MRNNEGRTQIPPELLEQFMKQQEEKIVGQAVQQPVMSPPVQQGGYQVPTDFVDLPSEGRFYPVGHPWHNKQRVEVRFMTTKEEDILSSQALAKAGVLLDRLIQSICVDRIDPSTVLPGDRNAILINARKNAYGSDYSFSLVCTNCVEPYEHTIDLSTIKNVEIDWNSITENGTVIVELPTNKAMVEFKILTQADLDKINNQIEIKKKHGLEVSETFELHRSLIQRINGNNNMDFMNSFISQMLLKDSKFLKKKYGEFRPDIDFTFTHTCEHCDHMNEGGVPIGTNFFWSAE